MQNVVFRLNDIERSHAGDPEISVLWCLPDELPKPTTQEIEETSQPNFCPCGTYKLIWLGGKLGAAVNP
jgi:hypothetical protein